MEVETKKNSEIGSKGKEVENKNLKREEQLAPSEMDMDEPGVAESGGMVDASNDSSKERPLPPKDSKNCVAKKPRSVSSDFGEDLDLELGNGEKESDRQQERKLSRQDRVELSRSFQHAVSSHDWESAEGLVGMADAHGLNDVLCVAVDAIWFLSDREELHAVVALIRRIVSEGAKDFTRAALRTSFLASCVSACRGRMTSLAEAVSFMGQKLHERLQESQGDEVLKAEASEKVHKFTEWALKCIGLHSRLRENKGRGNHNTIIEVQLQLSAFKTFLDLADNELTGKDFTEAFDAACFPLTLFSTTFDQGWVSGISAAAVQGLLELLVEGGADNVNQCFLEAARYGSTELVRILLQVNTQAAADVVDCSNPKNSKYYVVVVQYMARLNAETIKNFLYELNEKQIPKKRFNMRLAPEEESHELTGFVHNAVTCIGMETNIPVIIDEAITKLDEDFFWLGGGEVDLKLGMRTSQFLNAFTPFVVKCS